MKSIFPKMAGTKAGETVVFMARMGWGGFKPIVEA